MKSHLRYALSSALACTTMLGTSAVAAAEPESQPIPQFAAPSTNLESEPDSSGFSFTFTQDGEILPGSNDDDMVGPQSVGFGGCQGNFDGPWHQSYNRVVYGMNFSCWGSDYLPVVINLELQQEHLGFFYNTVDTVGNTFWSNYGVVSDAVPCSPGSGNDFRIKANVSAGPHSTNVLSNEVHVPCSV